MPITSEETSDKVASCRWCLSDIKLGARVCIECKKSQNPLFEYSRYLLTLSALLAALLSAGTYVKPSIESWIRSYLYPRIEVRSFQTESDRSVIENAGPSDVFIQYLTVEPDTSVQSAVQLPRFSHIVNTHLKHGEVLSIDLESEITKLNKRSLSPRFFSRMWIVPTSIQTVLFERMRVGDPKIRVVVMGLDHPQLSIRDEMAQKIDEMSDVMVKGNILSYPYLCSVHFDHRFSVTVSPYTFDCVGGIETMHTREELVALANNKTPE